MPTRSARDEPGEMLLLLSRVDEVLPVEQVLHVRLQAHPFRHREVHSGVGAGVAGQRDRIVDRGEHVGSVQNAKTGSQSRADLVVVPEREGVVRHLGDLCPGARGRRGAGDERVLIRIPAGDLPGARDASIRADFEAVRALAAGLHDPRRIIRIGRSRVGAVQPVDCRRDGQRLPACPT